MADMRRFLDLTGLGIYDEKIKLVISTGDANALAEAKKYFDDNKGLFEAAGAVATAQAALQAAIDAVDAKITAIKDGEEIDSFADVEAALAGKQAVGDYATKAEAQGYANAKDEAIAAAKKAGDDAQADLDAYKESNDAALATLDEKVGVIPETATATNLVDFVVEKTAGIATSENLAALTNTVTQLGKDVDAIEADYLKAADKEELAGDIEEVSGAVVSEKERAEAKEAELAASIKAISDDYLKSADKTELQNQITQNANAITVLTNGVDAEKVDGVKDLIAYVEEHGTEVTGMKEDIAENAENIATLQEQMTQAQTDIDNVEAAVLTKAEQSALDEVSGKVATAEGKIATLEGKMTTAEGEIDALQGDMSQAQSDIEALQAKFNDGEGSVADLISEAVKAEEDARKLADQTLQSNIDTLSGTVNTKANASDVTAIDDRLKTAESEIDTLQQEMDAVEAVAAAAAKQADLTALITRVGNTESSITTLQGEMDAVEGRLDDAEDAIELKAAQTDLDALAGRVSTNETNIAANASAISKITEITPTEINAMFA